MKTINTIKTGQNLRKLSEERGYSAIRLSRTLGFSEDCVFKWFAGINVPRVDTLVMLAEIFGKKIDDLIICDEIA